MVLTKSYLLAFGSVLFSLLLGSVFCSKLNTIWNTEEPHFLEVVCNVNNIKHQSTIFFENAQQHTAQVQRNGTSCNQQKGSLPILHCGCNLANNAVCNVSMSAKENTHGKDHCAQWRCSAGINGVLKRSNYLQMCLTVDESTGLQRRTVTCSNYQIYPDVTRWNVDGRILNSNTKSIKLMKLGAHNISLTYVDKEYNGSIYVCKLEEEHQSEWAISIIYRIAACSEVNISKQLSRHTLCGTGNPTITDLIEEYSATECPSVNIKSAVNISLCDAFNRDDMGARQFLGNVRGSFKLEVLHAASIRDFYVDGFPNQKNVILFGTQNISLKCVGHGNPPPEMALRKNENIYIKQNTSITFNFTLSSNQHSGIYTCSAFNALGEQNMSIQVYADIKDAHTDGFSWINICIYAACLIIIVVLAVIAFKRRFGNRFFPRTQNIKKSQNVSLEIVTQADIEPNDVNELTILETPSTGSVHMYETIPPSPIAGVSFDTVSDGADIIVIHTMESTQPGRYESLGQRDVSQYNNLEFD